jgi:hypothetical protein
MKYVTLSLLLILTLAPMVQAKDKPVGIPARRAAQLYIYDNNDPVNAFNMNTVLGVLEEAFSWASNNPQTNPAYWIGNAGEFNQARQALDYWLQNTTGMAESYVSLGDTRYMENAQRGDEVDIGDGMNHADQTYAYDHDLTVRNTIELGHIYYHYSRPHSNVRFNQISFTTGGTRYLFYADVRQSPIVLDMDGDGKLGASNGEWLHHKLAVKPDELVSFDITGDGFKELTEWVKPNDGLLIQYDGGEVSIKNLFGNEGGRYADGYEKLSLLDSNGDSKLTDNELSTLSIWMDKNGNALVDDGEISSLESLGITEIGLTHKYYVSTFVQNGSRKLMWDWHPATFMVKKRK